MAGRRSTLPNIPERNDPERKRILNVLAQRRYRQRRKERIQALEANAAANTVPGSKTPTAARSSDKETDSKGGFGIDYDNELVPREDHLIHDVSFQRDHSFHHTGSSSLPFADADPEIPSPVTELCARQSPFCLPPLDEMSTFMPEYFEVAGETADIGPELQSFEASQFTFPDDATLEVPELRVLTAGLGIAEMLGCAESIYDFTACRVFDSATLPVAHLPANLVSTDIQRQVPHHPLFDILPWPSVRSKLICVFAQPEKLRPPSARDPMAIMQLIFDMDDPSEGVRVSGSQIYEEHSWEIGQAVFTNWWWALDRAVVDNSNYLRAKRGASKLRLLAPG